ncbi:CPBP family intramembrane glutamic endopeptidase [Streptomyces sp. NBC_00878]|uniref:CPBP family intramembrane glutamic endopeptidase n=1 Tax=Streptomyces sp. NBC_00878 TaxID=2975854 RepID=UPI00224C99CC|nr:CPBP family intramembrane glutamic endopeptidase [Streptomyces sp. NBC_00878]MCX4910843.1 CPBP family intramembrane metalloprotease [Streptomyces sp. NBC_00878]
MTHQPLSEPLPFHRLARVSGRHRWWRPVLGTAFVVVAWLVLSLLLEAVSYVVGKATGRPENADGTIEFGPVRDTALGLISIALILPIVLLAVRWIGRRPAGTTSSVSGRLRPRWLLTCVLIATPVMGLLMGLSWLLPVEAGGEEAVLAGWDTFLPALAMLVLLVPLQASAEEYMFRGWLLHAFGAFARSPWIAVVPQAFLFAAAHGWGTPWGFADLAFFGLVTGWLTVRTGGLEAAIGLHVMSNLCSFATAAAFVDGLASDETAADAPWQLVALDTAMVSLYAAIVLWWCRRRPLARSTSPLSAPSPSLAAEVPYPGSVSYGPVATGSVPQRGPHPGHWSR